MHLNFKSDKLCTVSGKGIILARHLVVREILTLDQNCREDLSVRTDGEKKGFTV